MNKVVLLGVVVPFVAYMATSAEVTP